MTPRDGPSEGPAAFGHGRVRALLSRTGVQMLLALLGAMGLMATFAYYVLLALAKDSSRGFAPLSGFATVAGYRAFQERSLPLPTITSGTEAKGPSCFTAGMPTPGLAAGAFCRLPVERPAPPRPFPCSNWSWEICNAISLPAEAYRDEAFRGAFQSYIDDPCRFVGDFQRLRRPARRRCRFERFDRLGRRVCTRNQPRFQVRGAGRRRKQRSLSGRPLVATEAPPPRGGCLGSACLVLRDQDQAARRVSARKRR
jgi:hypothetical protein